MFNCFFFYSLVILNTKTFKSKRNTRGVLVIDSISPKPASVPEQKDLIIIDGFFAILKSPNSFRTVHFIIAN